MSASADHSAASTDMLAQQDNGPETADWKLEATARKAGILFGAIATSHSLASFQSVFWRFEHAKFHISEVERITSEFLERQLRYGPERRACLHDFLMKAEAHTLGAAQSLHAIPDTFAFGVYHALGLHAQPDALGSRGVSCGSVVKHIRRDGQFITSGDRLEALTKVPDWNVLHGLSNLAKHRSIIRSLLNQDLTDTREEPYELQFDPGEYKLKVGQLLRCVAEIGGATRVLRAEVVG